MAGIAEVAGTPLPKPRSKVAGTSVDTALWLDDDLQGLPAVVDLGSKGLAEPHTWLVP